MRGYYNGFSNRALWPLLHSLPGYAEFLEAHWEAYKEANALFARKVEAVARPGDTVWVHDYHLLLLPEILRERLPQVHVGFFLHVPFPAPEVLRVLPWYREALRGVLGADLVGFHTYDYLHAFLSSVRRFLGHDNVNGQLSVGNRAVIADVFPLGIDFEDFLRCREDPRVQRELARVTKRFAGLKVSFSIERLDYTKGIVPQLRAIRRFLHEHPEWRRKYAHLLVVSPSRERVETYKDLKREVDETVGRINGEYGSLDWTPVRYAYRYQRPEELRALYLAADVAVLTPVRDGMNLVAKEYLAARTHDPGVLVLSELAGASKELLEALVVNPNHTKEVADALARALEMGPDERRARAEPMIERLRENDAAAWSRRFLERLEHAVSITASIQTRRLGPRARQELVEAYRPARRRLLLLDYDGTLVGFSDDPERAVPPPALLELLRRLAADPTNTVVLVSGRPRKSLEAWFAGLRLGLSAEHGAWYKPPGATSWEAVFTAETSWKEAVRGVLDLAVRRIPGTFVEEKDYSLVWHYRKGNPQIAHEAARDLYDSLVNLTASTDTVVLPGKRVVEVKSAGSEKGAFYAAKLAKGAWDFQFAAGDDRTDETLFRALPAHAWSIRVGIGTSAARYSVDSPQELLALVEVLARAQPAGAARASDK